MEDEQAPKRWFRATVTRAGARAKGLILNNDPTVFSTLASSAAEARKNLTDMFGEEHVGEVTEESQASVDTALAALRDAWDEEMREG